MRTLKLALAAVMVFSATSAAALEALDLQARQIFIEKPNLFPGSRVAGGNWTAELLATNCNNAADPICPIPLPFFTGSAEDQVGYVKFPHDFDNPLQWRTGWCGNEPDFPLSPPPPPFPSPDYWVAVWGNEFGKVNEILAGN